MLIALYLVLFGGGVGPAFNVETFLAETKTAVVQIVEDVDREQRVASVLVDLERSLADFREQRVGTSKDIETVDVNYASGPEDYMKVIREMEKAWLDFEFKVAESHTEVNKALTEDEWEALFDHLKDYRKGKNQVTGDR